MPPRSACNWALICAELEVARRRKNRPACKKKRLLADAYEAIAGAISFDAGLPAAAVFFRRTLIEPALLAEKEVAFASLRLQILAAGVVAGSALSAPWNTVSTRNPDPTIRKFSKWKCGILDAGFSSSEGRSKKEAEQAAPSAYLHALELTDGVPS